MEPADPVPAGKRLTLQAPVEVTPHQPKSEPALALLGPQLDRAAYNWGDAFVYQWVVENRSKQPVTFPVLSDDDRVNRDMPGATIAYIGLRFADEAFAGQGIGGHALYGADSVPDSLVVVGPGERLRIRAPGRWALTRASKGAGGDADGMYQVRASVQMVRRGENLFAIESVTSATVSITKQ
ncbi:MAG: hypothetical protein M3541_07280 [Acidobacteriota bacterium]|nr:hypothetical protein [Acidobacteriota bacterium]